MKFKCPGCQQTKSVEEWTKNRSSSTGRGSYCKVCAKQREYIRRRTHAKQIQEYYHSKRGKAIATYRGMRRRVEGRHLESNLRIHGAPRGKHYYVGLDICSKQEFLDFTLNDPDFNRIYKAWVKSGKDNKLTPSIDRIDSRFGYTLSNMEWVTLSENSKNAWKYGRLRR